MHDSREMARNAPGMSIRDDSPMIDMGAMRSFRLGRLQAEIVAADCAAGVFFGPINVRYATGTKNAVISSMHSPFRCAVVPPEGGVTLFSWGRGEWCPETVAEVRPMPVFNYFPSGAHGAHRLKDWVGQMRELVEGGRIALDVAPPEAVQALERAGFEVIAGQPIKEHAAVVKSDEEIACMVHACTVAETAMARMRAALEPGMSENDLYAVLHHTNIAMGGEWIEYRLLASGGHINPWTAVEAGDKIIRPGELVAFDCGLVGPFGYSADVSRTFLCEPGRPTEAQRTLYRLAYENIQRNLELVKAGVSYRELSERSWMPPDDYIARRYPMMAHGIGMADEWPSIPWPIDWEEEGYDGVLQENQAICIESFIASEHGGEGVKLEEQVVVTRDGYQQMSTFPYEAALLE